MKRAVVGAGVLGAALMLASCAVPLATGVLEQESDGHSTWCAPVERYPDVALGMPLDFEAGTEVTIRGVSAVNADNVELSDLNLMTVDPYWRLSFSPYPPPAKEFPEEWKTARPAIGATVAAGEHVDLVARVQRIGAGEGKLDELLVRYEQGGVAYEAHSHVGLVMSTEPCSE